MGPCRVARRLFGITKLRFSRLALPDFGEQRVDQLCVDRPLYNDAVGRDPANGVVDICVAVGEIVRNAVPRIPLANSRPFQHRRRRLRQVGRW